MDSTPWTPALAVSVSPVSPQPGPMSTVGTVLLPALGSGNQWMRIWVPSKEVRS